jgi:hypothetical protein
MRLKFPRNFFAEGLMTSQVTMILKVPRNSSKNRALEVLRMDEGRKGILATEKNFHMHLFSHVH